MRPQHSAPDIARLPWPPGLRPSEAVWAVAGAALLHAVVLGTWAAHRTPEGLSQDASRDPSLQVPASAAALALPLSQQVVALEVRRLPGASPVVPVSWESAPAREALRPGPATSPAPASVPGATSPAAPSLALTQATPATMAAVTPADRVTTASVPMGTPGGVPLAAATAPASEAPRSFDVPAQTSPVADAPAATLLAAAQPTESRAATAADDDPPPPVYATRVPPPFRMSYALRRGALSGQAELTLQRAGPGYELELKGTALGLEVLGLRSQGSLGPHGLIPERFVDRRRGKDRLAANFDHGSGRITYSGSAASQPLHLGAQDRLSWMVQLAAILEAAPARHGTGSRISLSVSGARADVDTWTFIVQGRQRLNLPGGAVVEALRLTREPRRPYDTQVEVWMDPAQHHLPVRARLTVLPGGETLDLSSSGP
ncbi:MAG: DUF3108 domain-containing protein [Rubrivivax sp.]